MSLNFPIKMNDEIVFNPRAYDGFVFEMLSGTDNFICRQSPIHGGAPIAIFNSSTKLSQFPCDCEIPNCHNSSSIDAMISSIYNDMYMKT